MRAQPLIKPVRGRSEAASPSPFSIPEASQPPDTDFYSLSPTGSTSSGRLPAGSAILPSRNRRNSLLLLAASPRVVDASEGAGVPALMVPPGKRSAETEKEEEAAKQTVDAAEQRAIGQEIFAGMLREAETSAALAEAQGAGEAKGFMGFAGPMSPATATKAKIAKSSKAANPGAPDAAAQPRLSEAPMHAQDMRRAPQLSVAERLDFMDMGTVPDDDLSFLYWMRTSSASSVSSRSQTSHRSNWSPSGRSHRGSLGDSSRKSSTRDFRGSSASFASGI